jgi:hypothetical protein
MANIGKPLREGEIVVPREFPPPKEPAGPSREPARREREEPAERAARRRKEKTPA